MKIALIILAVFVVSIATVAIVGAMLPKEHSATRSAVVRKPPREVYAVIRELASTPAYEIVEDQPGQRLVSRIADKNLPYSGSWTYQLEAVPEGTRLTITENGEVYNPIFRFMSRFVFGHTSTMEQYLSSLQKRLN